MRRLIAPVALIAALALAGCSAAAEPVAVPTPVATATPEPTIDTAALEQGFVDTIRQETGTDLASYPDDGLIAVGNSVCESLRAGVPLPEIQSALTDAGFSENAAVNVIIGSGVLLCSDQGEKVVGGW